MSLHAFVAMPFGTKDRIDFNAVYIGLIKPALESEGFEVYRADEETRAGSIHPDMFQELLLADLVVVDLSIDNPNVWYELGVRHALRKGGVIPIQGRRDYLPFDVYAERTLRYSLTEGTDRSPAVPSPHTLDQDRIKLAQFARDTIESWHGRIISPVYYHLRDLPEPDLRQLRSDEAAAFWERLDQWSQRVEAARRKNRAGDIVLLADEAPARLVRIDALKKAGMALRSLGSYTFALAQFDAALKLEPDDRVARQQKGILLGRMNRDNEAREWLSRVAKDYPDDAESLALLGRVEKDAWVAAWRKPNALPEDMRREAEYEDARLLKAAEAYADAFLENPAHYYSGINAVALFHLLRYLSERDAPPAIDVNAMEAAVRWAIYGALKKNDRDYWARATLAELELLVSDSRKVGRAYRDAVAVADRDWFALDSSRQQLLLYKDLGFQNEQVEAGLDVLERELNQLEVPKGKWTPNKVLLFSGHMIDAPGRDPARFPPEKESIAADAIAARLDEFGVDERDIGLCGGACGGDILFAEACLKRGVSVQIRIPFKIPMFLETSVRFPKNGDQWQNRFHRVLEDKRTSIKLMPQEVGPSPTNANPYARNNLWQLYSALSYGAEKVHFMALWNGQAGDGPGGTEHMMSVVKRYAGKVYHLNTTTLW